MKQGTFKLKNRLGIHARPAAEIVKMSSKYNCKVVFEANGKKAEAKSVLMLIAIGAKKDTEVFLSIEGKDEQLLFEELAEYINKGFYED